MGISIEQVEYISKLAKLKFSASEKIKLSEELNEILHYMEKLNELDTEAIVPFQHSTEAVNVMREDLLKSTLPVETALKNAPAVQDAFFKVPKVIK